MFSSRSRDRTSLRAAPPSPTDATPAPQPAHGLTAVHDMGVLMNFQGRPAGRIPESSATIHHRHDSPRIINPTPKYGLMASSFRGRKRLVCFYCNKRSDIKYDGFMNRWECSQCDSTNFLDENGEITDPPATEFASPKNLQYAIPRPNSPLSSQSSEDSLFCSTCLKNQHLFTASLAQYDVELDTRDPSYRQKEKEYYAFRRRLEKTYPQVCEDCEPRVLGRMKEAGMTAKADHLRRLMDKTRAKISQKPSRFSSSETVEFAGKLLWYLGILGQLSWSVITLVALAFHTYSEIDETLSGSTNVWSEYFTDLSTSDVWVRNSLYCSILSLWWNPMFKQMNKGFVNHINGFGEWYKLQVLMIISRSLFYYISGTGVLSDPFSPPNIGAHVVMFVYILFLANRARRSLKVDMTPLWQSTPERLVNVGPKSNNPPAASDSMADILDSIAASPGRGYKSITPSPSPRRPVQRQVESPYDTPIRGPLGLNNMASSFDLSRGTQTNYMGVSTPQAPAQEFGGDEMDWTPAASKPESEYRAFKPLPFSGGNSARFGHSPVEEHSSPFWYKVPPAPTTPAQRLRNPPNQPQFQSTSQEVKENFFNNVAQRNSNKGNFPNNQRTERPRHDMELQQPKFFPPPPAGEVGNSLADLLTSFSLESSDPKPPVVLTKQFQWDHFGQTVVLALGLFFWNHSFSHHGEYTMKVMLAIMTGCIAIGARTIFNQASLRSAKRSNGSRVFGMILGGLECLSALYGIAETLAGRGECTNCASLGTILLGGMLLQEFWYASFG